MPDDIELATVNEPMILKALAYDRLAALEENENEVAAPLRAELQAINARLQQLVTEPEPDPKPVHNGRVTKSTAKAAK